MLVVVCSQLTFCGPSITTPSPSYVLCAYTHLIFSFLIISNNCVPSQVIKKNKTKKKANKHRLYNDCFYYYDNAHMRMNYNVNCLYETYHTLCLSLLHFESFFFVGFFVCFYLIFFVFVSDAEMKFELMINLVVVRGVVDGSRVRVGAIRGVRCMVARVSVRSVIGAVGVRSVVGRVSGVRVRDCKQK